LETLHLEDDKQWLTYWVVYTCISSVENVAAFLVGWIPAYYEVKFLVILWMVHPQTKVRSGSGGFRQSAVQRRLCPRTCRCQAGGLPRCWAAGLPGASQQRSKERAAGPRAAPPRRARWCCTPSSSSRCWSSTPPSWTLSSARRIT
jgi:hypothetical protein